MVDLTCLIKECPLGKWGHNCQEHCDCRNGGTCDFATGACRCTANWMGQKCELPCQDVSKVILLRYYEACVPCSTINFYKFVLRSLTLK